jgi:hypothetical protein
MDTMSSLVGGLFGDRVRNRMKLAAAEAIANVNLSEILQLAGADLNIDEADAALKAVIAERIAEYASNAMKESRRRGIKLGAAAIVIASRKI